MLAKINEKERRRVCRFVEFLTRTLVKKGRS
ncbi:hypothetical protein Pan216_01070 [Planctomycetes bacterium Pan216]|uniref:Uncharacterized protein n=1 Tax=Kolteria novifilia TaxID=2527975 RepID=A0A518AX19_9BACT|nr:hypothetical protein Pan216_01070 [Planctomycetes bacterium Pan216]